MNYGYSPYYGNQSFSTYTDPYAGYQETTIQQEPVITHTQTIQTPPSDFVTTTERSPFGTNTRTYSPGRAVASQTIEAPFAAYVGPAYNPPVAANTTSHYEGLDTVTTTHFDGPFGGSSVTTVSGPNGTFTTRNDAFGSETQSTVY